MTDQTKLILKRLGIIFIALLTFSFTIVFALTIYTQQLGSMVFALLIGGFGSGVSVFRRIPTLPESQMIVLADSWWNLITPLLIGFVMGGVIYLVFFAGILTGDGGSGLFTSNLFPNFTNPVEKSDVSHPLDVKTVLAIRPSSIQDFGKLLVWCFLAGYSERLVPTLLDGLEKKAIDTKE